MKITTNTAEMLIVDDRPWIFGIMLGGMALVFAGVAIDGVIDGDLTALFFLLGSAFCMLFFYIFVRRTQAVFHGQEGWMEIRRQNLLGYTKVRHDLPEIERAIIETNKDSDGGNTHRVTFIIPNGQSAGRHPMTQAYTSGKGAKNAVTAINSWLDSHRQST